jgi:hypothetical protein
MRSRTCHPSDPQANRSQQLEQALNMNIGVSSYTRVTKILSVDVAMIS